MEVLRSLGRGFKTTNEKWKLVVYLWLINFIFSILMITPIYFLLQKDFSRSLMGDRIAQGFDLLWFGDIVYKYKDFYPAFLGWILIPSIFFLLLFIFLNGGILGRVAAQEGKVNLEKFLADCGKYFFRFFRVFLISLVAYFVLFSLILRAVSALFKIWTKNASTEWVLIFSSNLKFLVMILLFSIVRMFFDYVRVRLVAEGSKKKIRATVLTFHFIGKRFLKVWSLYLLVALITIILGIVCLAIWQYLPQIGILIVILFILQQVYIISRMWTRVLFFSTEYHFFKA